MAEQVTDTAGAVRLAEEIDRLRAKIAELQTHIAQLDQLAHEDSLSKLPNRRGFMRELDRLIARVGRYEVKAALLFVDLDGLKMINDTFGHRAGDEALIQVAGLLTAGVRRSDVVARIGGDEFGILLENVDRRAAHETATRLGEMICGCNFSHDGQALPLSIAVGVGMIEASDTAEAVLARADEEMYRSKTAA